MAKTTKTDRQAVIKQIRKKQKGAEQRRGFMIVGVCTVIALLIVGAAAFQPIKNWWELRQFEKVDLAEVGAPASACEDITTKNADGNQDHVQTGTPVEYSTSPPAFGAHWNEAGSAPAPMERKLYTSDRPALESLVHNLEHGYTLLWFDETVAADEDQMQELRAIADKLAGTSNFRTKFKAVPWTAEDGDPFPDGQHVAITHWSAGGESGKQAGIFQYCSAPSGAALKAFMIEYPYTDSPEPGAM